MLQPQFNFTPGRADADGRSLGLLVIWLNKVFSRIASNMKGPQALDWETVVTAATINPALVDLTYVTLGGNVTLTLDMTNTRAGTIGCLELLQDATGGRLVTWVNALNTPAISATANKRTMLLLVRSRDGWTATVLASGY